MTAILDQRLEPIEGIGDQRGHCSGEDRPDERDAVGRPDRAPPDTIQAMVQERGDD